MIIVPKSDSFEYFQTDFRYFYYFNFKRINLITPAAIGIIAIVSLILLAKKYRGLLKNSIETRGFQFVMTSFGLVISFALFVGITQFFLNYEKNDSFTIDKDVLGVEVKRDTTQFNFAISHFTSRLNSAKGLKEYLISFQSNHITNLELRDNGSAPQSPLGYEITNDSIKIHIVRIEPNPEDFNNYSILFFLNKHKLQFNTYSEGSCDKFFFSFFNNPSNSGIGDFSCIVNHIITKEERKLSDLVETKRDAELGSLNWQIFVFENLFKAVFNSEGYYKSTSWISRILSFSIYIVFVLVFWPIINLAVEKNRIK